MISPCSVMPQGLNFSLNEAISKVIQKMAKMASQRTAKGSLKLLPADITAENAPFRRSKRGCFDNFEEF